MTAGLNIASARKARTYTRSEMFRRIWWMLGQPLFRFSPRPFFEVRRLLLRCYGANIGSQVHIYSTVRVLFPWNLTIGSWSAVADDVWIYNPGRVVIGEKVTISHKAHLCAGTHDYTKTDFPVLKLPIHIGDEAWICSDAFISPGMTIGSGAVVGARAVVTKPVAPWTVVAGNPARLIGQRQVPIAL